MLFRSLCVSGRLLLLDFCQERGVPVRICGKLVVASDESELRAPTNTEGGLITALAPRGDRFVSVVAPEVLVTFDAR